ncbi:Histidine kinase (fragment) [Flavobacterium sp. 9AF]
MFATFRYFLEEILIYNFIRQHNYNFSNDDLIITYLFDSFYYTFRFSLYSSVVYFLFRYHENKDKIHQLNIEQQNAQLSTLKSQLSPHFLFNTLNNFYVELYDNQPETADAILRLSNLLRYVTYKTNQDFSLLQEEIVFIKDYIYFFERRYEANFHVYLIVNGTITNQKIPSLILIHFIENVFKHGIIDTKENPAIIEISCTNNFIEISTTNQINNSEKYMEKGIGSKNIEKRLQLLFENKYSLNYKKENNNYKAYLKFPI